MPERHAPPSGSAAPASESAAQMPLPGGVDPISSVLRTVRLSGALFFEVDASSPWCVDIPPAERFAGSILAGARHVVSYHVVLEGEGLAAVPGSERLAFAAGDVIVFPHGDAYLMESEPGVPPELDTAATLAFLREMAAGRLPFVVTEGGGRPPRARFVCGFLGCDARPFNPLLAALPRLLHVRGFAGDGGFVDRLLELALEEGRAARLGSACMKLALSEILFIEVIRRHLAQHAGDGTGWLAGLADPAVGRALALLHGRPAEPWGLSRLARESGVSRSVLAERFSRLVGLSPMRYLAAWRVQCAIRLLTEPTNTVAAVAAAVGYASEAAFSRAFTRLAGRPPTAWRAAERRPRASGPEGPGDGA